MVSVSQPPTPEWQDWYEENLAEETEQAAMDAEREEEAAAAAPAAKAPPAVPAPVTLVVLQNPPFIPAVLPPGNLPYVHLHPSVLAEQHVQLEAQEEWEWREGKLQQQALEEPQEAREQQEEAAQQKGGLKVK